MSAEEWEVFHLQEVMSGDDEELWVSLGFSTDFQEYDVLHIVCPKKVEGCEPIGNLYFCRYDQAYSEYDCADRILVTTKVIDISLNSKGRGALGFSQNVRFFWPDSAEGFREAMEVFEGMVVSSYGGAIELWSGGDRRKKLWDVP